MHLQPVGERVLSGMQGSGSCPAWVLLDALRSAALRAPGPSHTGHPLIAGRAAPAHRSFSVSVPLDALGAQLAKFALGLTPRERSGTETGWPVGPHGAIK